MGNCVSVDNPPHEETDEMTSIDRPQNTQRPLLRALYDFEKQDKDELSMASGDLFYEISRKSDDDEEETGWWKVEHCDTGRTGLVPSNYLISEDTLPFNLDAYYDIGRREADRLLMMMGNSSGTFIVRPSNDEGKYALSIRYYSEAECTWTVKHYKILNSNESGYSISNKSCPTIDALIAYFKENRGLCCLLTMPCPRQYKPPVHFKELEVNRDCLVKSRLLGEGNFGQVWLASWSKKIEVAVKSLKCDSMDREQFIEEARIMHRLHHRRIVQLLGVCTVPVGEEVLIITENMEKGALLDYLKNNPEGNSLNYLARIDILDQVVDGMVYLEDRNFIHRDLRAANILVNSDGSVKVADFGLARITQDDVYQGDKAIKLPIRWTALEAVLLRQFSVKSDVWSFGILIFEVFTNGKIPYEGLTNQQVVNQLQNGYRLPKPRGHVDCPDNLYALMLDCWKKEPSERPTFIDLKLKITGDAFYSA